MRRGSIRWRRWLVTRRANQIEWARAPWGARGAFPVGLWRCPALLSLRGRTRFRVRRRRPRSSATRRRRRPRPETDNASSKIPRFPNAGGPRSAPSRSTSSSTRRSSAIRRSKPPKPPSKPPITTRMRRSAASSPRWFWARTQATITLRATRRPAPSPKLLFPSFPNPFKSITQSTSGAQLAQGGGPRGPAPGPDFSEAGRL